MFSLKAWLQESFQLTEQLEMETHWLIFSGILSKTKHQVYSEEIYDQY